ncbi:phosphonate ABC transporter ATP-binding protein [Halopseudomonas salegens]|uniref:Phosphonate transport system ATP-binding protein n=1 Tax=Halopseudomonas salegens TaxID=1434072 RepID=A0A1H2FN28_9GAMM|nr:phosphonate ABC transporter ATP-binding protein [Halopseudomonas salegens]SDU08763.1 phosphonate transport system ATP-binding protein [Halopseudomonas salegens]
MSVRLEGVGLTHANGFVALQDINLQIAHGERVAIIGSSGAGKTSLLRLLGTSLRPGGGTLELLGNQPGRLRGRALRQLRSRIGLIHQSPPLPPRQRVITAVLAGRLGQWSLAKALLSLCWPLDIDGARAALAPLDLDEKLFARCDQLSGGQLQRVGIARVLYQNAELLLADEPVSSMDPVLAEHTLAILNQLASQRGQSLIASLHAVDLALQHFPRVIGLRQGQLLFDKPSEAVTRDDLQQLYANQSLDTPEAPVHGNSPATATAPPRCV